MTTETKIKPAFEEKGYQILHASNTIGVQGFVYGDTGLGYHACPCGYGYVVDHVPSGYKVLASHFTKRNVQPFVRGLAKLNMPWKEDLPKFNKAEEDDYHNLIARWAIFTNWNH